MENAIELNIVYKKIDELVEFKKNAKVHTAEQIQLIAKMIEKFGWTQNIVINQDNVIIQGHGRYQAAKLLGLAEVPCRVMESVYTEESLDALRIIDNRLAETGYDQTLLKQDMEAYSYDFSDYGVSFELTKIEHDEMEVAQRDHMETSLSEEKKRQIVLYYDLDRYNLFIARAGDEIEKNSVKNISQLIKKLLIEYKCLH